MYILSERQKLLWNLYIIEIQMLGKIFLQKEHTVIDANSLIK